MNLSELKTKSETHTQVKQNIIQYTPWNDRGEGNFWYLDRHFLDCGKTNSRFMNGFQFERNGDNIRYRFSCTPFSFNQTPSSFSTRAVAPMVEKKWGETTYYPMNSTPYLTQKVECPNGSGLVNFGLVRRPEDKENEPVDAATFINMVANSFDPKHATMVAWNAVAKALGWVAHPGDLLNYYYSCAPIPSLKGCWPVSTPWTYIKQGRSEYLDRQTAIWQYSNQVISGFQMESNVDGAGNGNIRFNYTVCTI